MSNILVDYNNFKKDIADVLNKYINKVPAIFITEHLSKLEKQFNTLAEEQLKQQMKSEVAECQTKE